MKKVIVMVLILVVLSGMPFAYAASDSNICNWAESKNWAVSAPGKLVRGVINVSLGWTNLFVQPFKEESIVGGIGKGLGDFFLRTLQGAGEIFLFWIPPVPDEPLQECAFYDWGLLERSSV